MKEPNFFIVGAPKCGTTALFDYLSQHPQTWCPRDKEPNYFATDFEALRGPRTREAYLALFEGADERHLAIGEASVLYFFSAEAVPTIRREYPQAKLIVMIRNPVDMVYSFHSQLLNTLNEDQRDFARAWALQEQRARGRQIPAECLVPEFLQYGEIGRLSRNIRRIAEHFPPEQLKLVVFDDMREDPQAVFDQVCDYLGLDRYTGVDFRVVNANRVQKSRVVAKFTERPPSAAARVWLTRIKRALGLQNVALRRVLARLNSREARRPPLSAEMRARLVAHFSDEVTELERLTGRDLSHWRE